MPKTKTTYKDRQQAINRRRNQEALKGCEFFNELMKLPANIRNEVLNAPPLGCQVIIDPQIRQLDGAQKLAAEIKHLLENDLIAFKPPVTHRIVVGDFFSVYAGICANARKTCLTMGTSKHQRNLAVFADSFMAFWYTISKDILRNLMTRLYAMIESMSSFDGHYYYFTLTRSARLFDKGVPFTIGIYAKPAEKKFIQFVGENKKRPVYRVVSSVKIGSVESLNIDGKLFGVEGNLPVYIQSHAMHRLRERMSPLDVVSESYLFHSLQSPELVKTDTNDRGVITYWLVYKLSDLKAGYLLTQIVEGVVVIVSFLFLTMNGTPESALFAQRLYMGRSSIAWNSLDSMKAFLTTDIMDDPVTSTLLRECGCGGLEELRKIMKRIPDTESVPYAHKLKSYLRIDDRREREILERIKENCSTE